MKFDLQKTILSLVGVILIASISYFGSSILSAVQKVNNDNVEILLMKKDIENISKDVAKIQAEISLSTSQEGQLTTDVEVLKSKVNALENRR